MVEEDDEYIKRRFFEWKYEKRPKSLIAEKIFIEACEGINVAIKNDEIKFSTYDINKPRLPFVCKLNRWNNKWECSIGDKNIKAIKTKSGILSLGATEQYPCG